MNGQREGVGRAGEMEGHTRGEGLPGGSVVKHLVAMQQTRVQLLSRENTSEEEMATHSGILAWRIPWTQEPGGLQSMGSKRVKYD